MRDKGQVRGRVQNEENFKRAAREGSKWSVRGGSIHQKWAKQRDAAKSEKSRVWRKVCLCVCLWKGGRGRVKFCVKRGRSRVTQLMNAPYSAMCLHYAMELDSGQKCWLKALYPLHSHCLSNRQCLWASRSVFLLGYRSILSLNSVDMQRVYDRHLLKVHTVNIDKVRHIWWVRKIKNQGRTGLRKKKKKTRELRNAVTRIHNKCDINMYDFSWSLYHAWTSFKLFMSVYSVCT